MSLHPQEAAYWLHLAFGPERGSRREINGLVLTAHRRERLGLLDLLRLDPAELPPTLQPYTRTLERLRAAEGLVAAQAFTAAELERRRVRLLPITDPQYPAQLAQRLTPGAAPTVLLVAGEMTLLAAPGVAVSGSRDAGTRGLAFARAAAGALAGRGFPVVSGLARGVDSEALEGALEANGVVIGIAPEGLLASRWARDRRLASGKFVVISEFAPKQPWQAGAAMARNRTIAGMSRALIVADCVADGGTTHQVEVHLKLGLSVFVRRGEGEGGKNAVLAALSGVDGIPWEAGVVVLPEALRDPSVRDVSAIPDVTPPVRPPDASPEQRSLELPSPAEPAPDQTSPQHQEGDAERAEQVPDHGIQSPRALILAALAPGPCSLDELTKATAMTEGKLRRHLEALLKSEQVQRFKLGRRYCYSRSTRARSEEHGPLFAST
ncbi:DNA-processing protein DprA [Nannocystis sp. RBIL2]|uniref:DNA-processing protein DprA n=1 Tax=Nannocystis sp. RBIL2 TaxID=2996788 RepID=UPI002272147C|nr:DNA-processing protein DprA [Nannocystis sp. RBIL2]MCY1065606.1 DNA-processing protein DprA [Nannocystis sp. RBIL2]